MVDCLQDDACFEGLSCTATECVNGDFQCVVDCHDGDVELATQLFEALVCVVAQCNSPCNL